MRAESSHRPRVHFKFILAGLVILSGLLVFDSQIAAQTICSKDIALFRGRMQRVPIYDKQFPEVVVGTRPNVSAFSDWDLDTVRSDGKVWSQLHPSEQNFQCLYIDPGPSGQGFYPRGNQIYFIMNDIFGYGGGRSLLSQWERVLPDSLRFICAQEGPFEGRLSSVRLVDGAAFPDSSVVLVISENFGDACSFGTTYYFLRGEADCEFSQFYKTSFNQRSVRQFDYNFSWFLRSQYQVVETSAFVTRTPSYADCDTYTLDSVSSRIINLWEMAKDSFYIKE